MSDHGLLTRSLRLTGTTLPLVLMLPEHRDHLVIGRARHRSACDCRDDPASRHGITSGQPWLIIATEPLTVPSCQVREASHEPKRAVGGDPQNPVTPTLSPAAVQLIADDLSDIEEAAARLTVQGARYPEQLERMTNL